MEPSVEPNFEEAGTLVTAGLAAREIDAASAPRTPAGHGPVNCLNCGAMIAERYCPACGQAAHVHRSLLHLLEEMLHGVFHFDTKGWHTLPLLIAHPGQLTRRYIDGARTRYVSPLALYLFCVFLMYAVISFTAHAPARLELSDAQRREASEELLQSQQEQQAAVNSAREQLSRAQARGNAEEIAEAAAELKAEQLALATETKTAGLLSATALKPAGTDSWQSQLAKVEVHTGSPWLDTRVHHAFQNPDLFLYKMKTTAYKWSFMLIPISLPLIWLMFVRRRDIAMYDHAVFSLYSLSFMALLFTVVIVVSSLGLHAFVDWMVMVVPPLHMYLQLKDTYALSRFGAAWRTLALLGMAGSAFVTFLLLVAALAL
jgi:hypothetical protein